jgi:hypothetical protein
MRELFIYGIVAVSSVAMLTYTVHMFLGGIVSERTETLVMIGVALTAISVIALMAFDVARRRRNSG